MIAPARCSGCGEQVRVTVERGEVVASPCRCRPIGDRVAESASTPTKGGRSAGAVRPEAPAARPWSNAKPTDCGCGRRHPSKMQARVCQRLRLELVDTDKARLFHDVRFPLLAIAPKDTGAAHTITVDFILVDARGAPCWRAIDAKDPKRVSRDWKLRKAAFRASYGIEIEEVTR